MNRCSRPLTRLAKMSAGPLITLAAFALVSTDAAARTSSGNAHATRQASQHRSASASKHRHAKREADKRTSEPSKKAPAREEANVPALSGDLAIIRDAVALARRGKTTEATELENGIGDPTGRKLVEWFILRHPETSTSFNRYAAFISANPDWPSITLFRKRAEATLWQDRSSDPAKDASQVHVFTGNQPTTTKGKFAVAR